MDDCLISLITRYGFPKVIIRDRGSEFRAHVFRGLMEKLGVTLKYMSHMLTERLVR
jgi:hypothetical protein